MQTIYLSLVMGTEGSGVSTLLSEYGKRADMRTTLVVDPDRPADVGFTGATGPEELTRFLHGLQSKRQAGALGPFDRVVLASGDLKAPSHLLSAITADPELAASFRLDGITLAVDVTDDAGALMSSQRLLRASAIADRIVLTKTDRQEPAAVKTLAGRLKALNPPAPILRARHGDIGPARLVDSGLFDPITRSVDIDRWLCEAAYGWEANRRGANGNVPPLRRPITAEGLQFFAATLDAPIGSTALAAFLKLLVALRGTSVLRLKGIIATAEQPDRPALIDGTEHIMQPLLWLTRWPTADRRTRLVFVTTGISEALITSLLRTLSDQPDPARAAGAPAPSHELPAGPAE